MIGYSLNLLLSLAVSLYLLAAAISSPTSISPHTPFSHPQINFSGESHPGSTSTDSSSHESNGQVHTTARTVETPNTKGDIHLDNIQPPLTEVAVLGSNLHHPPEHVVPDRPGNAIISSMQHIQVPSPPKATNPEFASLSNNGGTPKQATPPSINAASGPIQNDSSSSMASIPHHQSTTQHPTLSQDHSTPKPPDIPPSNSAKSAAPPPPQPHPATPSPNNKPTPSSNPQTHTPQSKVPAQGRAISPLPQAKINMMRFNGPPRAGTARDAKYVRVSGKQDVRWLPLRRIQLFGRPHQRAFGGGEGGVVGRDWGGGGGGGGGGGR